MTKDNESLWERQNDNCAQGDIWLKVVFSRIKIQYLDSLTLLGLVENSDIIVLSLLVTH